jgi:hypothetical protein
MPFRIIMSRYFCFSTASEGCFFQSACLVTDSCRPPSDHVFFLNPTIRNVTHWSKWTRRTLTKTQLYDNQAVRNIFSRLYDFVIFGNTIFLKRTVFLIWTYMDADGSHMADTLWGYLYVLLVYFSSQVSRF